MEDKNKKQKEFKKIKTGWDRLDEKTKTKLKKMGIHPLWHTPGKLLNAKGYIPGAVGAFGTVWGKIKMTGDMAEKNMGFRPKEGAYGVLLCRKRYVDNNGKVKSGIFATSLMRRSPVPTEKIKSVWDRTKILNKMTSKHMRDIIYPIWEPLVKNKNRKPWSGYHYFTGLNHSALGHLIDWNKLLISKGSLPPLKKVYPNYYYAEENRINIVHPLTINKQLLTKQQFGIGIVDTITGDFFHISPEQLATEIEERIKTCGISSNKEIKSLEPLHLQWKIEKIRKYYIPPNQKQGWVPKIWSRFYIYVYYKEGKEYSNSISSRIHIGKEREKNGMPIIIEISE